MSRLSWRDTASPNFGNGVSDVIRANQLLQDSIGGVSSSLGAFATNKKTLEAEALAKQQEAAQGQLLAGVLQQAGEGRGTQELLKNAGAQFAANPAMYNAKNLESVLKHLGTAAQDDTTLTNLDQTNYTNDRSRGFDSAEDAYAPVESRVLALRQAGRNEEAEQLQAENIDLVSALKGDRRIGTVAAGSAERNSQQSNVNAINSNRIASEGNTRSWISSREATQGFKDGQTDRSEGRFADEILARVTQDFSDPADQVAALVSLRESGDVPAALIQKSINKISGTSQLTDGFAPAGGQGVAGQRGQTGVGGQGSATNLNDDGDNLSEEILQGMGVQADQRNALLNTQRYEAAGKSQELDIDVINRMRGEGGVMEGRSAGEVRSFIKKVREQAGGAMTAAQAEIIAGENTEEYSGWERLWQHTPMGTLSNALFSDNIAVGERGLLGYTPSKSYVNAENMQQSIDRYLGTESKDTKRTQATIKNQQAEIQEAQKKKDEAFQKLEKQKEFSKIRGSDVPEKYIESFEEASKNLIDITKGIATTNTGDVLAKKPKVDGNLKTPYALWQDGEKEIAAKEAADTERRDKAIREAWDAENKQKSELARLKKLLKTTNPKDGAKRSSIMRSIERVEEVLLPEATQERMLLDPYDNPRV